MRQSALLWRSFIRVLRNIYFFGPILNQVWCQQQWRTLPLLSSLQLESWHPLQHGDISRHMWRNSCAKQLMKPAGWAETDQRRASGTSRRHRRAGKLRETLKVKGHSLERMTDGENLVNADEWLQELFWSARGPVCTRTPPGGQTHLKHLFKSRWQKIERKLFLWEKWGAFFTINNQI